MQVSRISPSAFSVRDNETNLTLGVISTRDGAIVIDTGPTPAFGADLALAIDRLTRRPVRYVINSHFHPEHTGGNGAFDAPVMAHKTCAREMRRANGDHGSNEHGPTVPQIQFDRHGYIRMGGRTIEVMAAPGHTDGSLAVHLVEENVLFAGDNVVVECYPVLDHAHPVKWLQTLIKLRDLTIEKVVPGHGPVAGREAIDHMVLYLENLITTVTTLRQRGQSREEIESSRRFIRLASGTGDPRHRENIRQAMDTLAAS